MHYMLKTKRQVYRGVEESGRPRWSHKPEIVGSNPTSATSLNVMEVPVVTKRYGGRWERKERNYRP